MSALVTEHFVLQSARTTTVSEAVGRSALYLTVVSSAVVAFGFFAAARHGLTPVVATVLPALIILGVFSFVRLVETSVENVVFLRRMEAIRRYYATLVRPPLRSSPPPPAPGRRRRWPAPECAQASPRCSLPARA